MWDNAVLDTWDVSTNKQKKTAPSTDLVIVGDPINSNQANRLATQDGRQKVNEGGQWIVVFQCTGSNGRKLSQGDLNSDFAF